MPKKEPNPPAPILLVDDDPLVREATAWMLSDAGHAVVEAEDGMAALRALEAIAPDHPAFGLVITDINMPGMDGAELARQVRARWPDLPVLLVSGRPQPSGVMPFMPKPFGWSTLMEAVGKLLHPGLNPGAATPDEGGRDTGGHG